METREFVLQWLTRRIMDMDAEQLDFLRGAIAHIDENDQPAEWAQNAAEALFHELVVGSELIADTEL